jgi:hypothetical protein
MSKRRNTDEDAQSRGAHGPAPLLGGTRLVAFPSDRQHTRQLILEQATVYADRWAQWDEDARVIGEALAGYLYGWCGTGATDWWESSARLLR